MPTPPTASNQVGTEALDLTAVSCKGRHGCTVAVSTGLPLCSCHAAQHGAVHAGDTADNLLAKHTKAALATTTHSIGTSKDPQSVHWRFHHRKSNFALRFRGFSRPHLPDLVDGSQGPHSIRHLQSSTYSLFRSAKCPAAFQVHARPAVLPLPEVTKPLPSPAWHAPLQRGA